MRKKPSLYSLLVRLGKKDPSTYGNFYFIFLKDFFFFLMWAIFKVFNLLQYCFCFYVLVFWSGGMWILAPQPRMEPVPSALKGEVLTTRLPGKFP